MLAWEREKCLEDIRAALRAFEESIPIRWTNEEREEDRRQRLALVDRARAAVNRLEEEIPVPEI